jgi:Lipopolysaccharide-assembly
MRAGTRQINRRQAMLALSAAVTLAAEGGCGYSVHAPFDAKIRTVYIPIFRSITYRRDLNLQLNELIIKEMERRTPFRHVGKIEDADTILDGTVILADKNIVVENPFNLPRQLTSTVNATVRWTHNPPLKEELDQQPTVVAETVNFVPEVGETSMTAFYRTNQALAKQIVDMMETAW